MKPNDCFWCFDAPAGPSVPFAPGFIMLDTIRVIVIVLCSIEIIAMFAAAYFAPTIAQKFRFIVWSLCAFLVISVEVEHLGDNPTWRLPMATVSSILGLWSVVSFLVYERPKKDRDARQN